VAAYRELGEIIRQRHGGRTLPIWQACHRLSLYQAGSVVGLRGDNLGQCTEAARFRAVLCGRAGQSGGVPVGHDFLPDAHRAKQGGCNSAEANDIEQAFHGCDPPDPWEKTQPLTRVPLLLFVSGLLASRSARSRAIFAASASRLVG
jgi:hypothetical protein